jgi:Domain of unknown function (DUF4920)
MFKLTVLAISVLALGACAHSNQESSLASAKSATDGTSMASPVDKPATRAFGAEMPSDPAIVPLAQMDLAKVGDQAVKVSGRIGKVCQMKGCWMMLSDGDVAVRVKFGEDAFFIPKDSQGEAIAYGHVKAREMSLAESKHMAQDGGLDPNTVTSPQTEYQLVATGVILK